MGRIGAAAAPAWAALALPLLLLLLAGVACPGARAGLTSEYRRHLGSAIDMPLDADVFRPPPGHNAPEQVRHREYMIGWSPVCYCTATAAAFAVAQSIAASRYSIVSFVLAACCWRPVVSSGYREFMFSVCSILVSSRNLHFFVSQFSQCACVFCKLSLVCS